MAKKYVILPNGKKFYPTPKKLVKAICKTTNEVMKAMFEKEKLETVAVGNSLREIMPKSLYGQGKGRIKRKRTTEKDNQAIARLNKVWGDDEKSYKKLYNKHKKKKK